MLQPGLLDANDRPLTQHFERWVHGPHSGVAVLRADFPSLRTLDANSWESAVCDEQFPGLTLTAMVAAAFPEMTTAIAHLREVLGDKNSNRSP